MGRHRSLFFLGVLLLSLTPSAQASFCKKLLERSAERLRQLATPRHATPREANLFRPQLEEIEARVVPSNTNIVDYRNAPSTGIYATETQLTPANVNTNTFGQLWNTSSLSGQIYAQPLYLANQSLVINGQAATKNVVIVATEANLLYWIDASTGAVLRTVNFNNYGIVGATVTPVPSADVGTAEAEGHPSTNTQIYPQIGITSTPLAYNGFLYVVAYKKEAVPGQAMVHYIYDLEKVNIATGAVQQTNIADTGWDGTNYTYFSGDPIAAGNGDGSINGTVYFNARQEGQRPAVTLVNDTAGNKNLVLGFEGHDDLDPYHGWMIAFSVANLTVTGVFCTTPNGSEAGIWRTPVTDGKGNLWFTTGNGTFDETLDNTGMPINGDYGDSVVRLQLTPYGFIPVDYFTPSNQAYLSDHDLDYDSGGLVMLPNNEGLVAIGKDGTIDLLDPYNMGGFHANGNQVLQEITGALPAQLSFGSVFTESTFYQNTLYVFSAAASGRAFTYTPGAAAPLSAVPASVTSTTNGYPGAFTAISSNNGANPILWALSPTGLTAYPAAATGLTTPLYSTAQDPTRDAPPGYVKFTVPIVANGHVFVAGNGGIAEYGILPPSLPFSANFNQANTPQLPAPWILDAGQPLAIKGQAAVGPLTLAEETVNGLKAANVVVSANFQLPVGGGGFGLMARYQGPGDQNFYLATVNGSTVNIWRNLAGVWTRLVQAPYTGTSGLLTFSLYGTQLTVSINNVPMATAEDAAIPGGGTVGIRDGGVTLDNFSAIASVAPSQTTLPFTAGFPFGPSWNVVGGSYAAANGWTVTSGETMATLNAAPVANVSVSSLVDDSNGADVGVFARYSVTAGKRSMYWAGVSAGKLTLWKDVAGVWTQLGSVSIAGKTGTINLSVNGNEITANFDGSDAISVSDNSISGAGLVGIRSNGGKYLQFSAQ